MAWQVRKYHVGKGGSWPQFLVTGSEVCSRREEHIAEGKRYKKLCSSGRFHWVWEDRLGEQQDPKWSESRDALPEGALKAGPPLPGTPPSLTFSSLYPRATACDSLNCTCQDV